MGELSFNRGGLQIGGELQIGGGFQIGGGLQNRGGLQIEGEFKSGEDFKSEEQLDGFFLKTKLGELSFNRGRTSNWGLCMCVEAFRDTHHQTIEENAVFCSKNVGCEPGNIITF